jgi:hypothetical protein
VLLTTGVIDTGDKFAAGVTAISIHLRKDVTSGVVDTGGRFAAGVNDAGGKIATGVNDAGGAP